MSGTVWILAGATASGKTEIAVQVARAAGCEIVCADARQVFRALDCGTGKPDAVQRAEAPHHLFDMLELGESLTAARWARAAAEACARIWSRGRTPLLVGGSGLYLRALREGLHPEPGHDPQVRARLEEDWSRSGSAALHARLSARDAATAARLAPADRQRVLRALEVAEVSGRPLSWWHRQPRVPVLAAEYRAVELRVPAATLARRIAERTPRLFAGGLVPEVAALLAAGHGADLRALRAIGYDEVMDQLEGRCDPEVAIARTTVRTRQLAKRQRTWFRHQFEGAVLTGEAADAGAVFAALSGPRPGV